MRPHVTRAHSAPAPRTREPFQHRDPDIPILKGAAGLSATDCDTRLNFRGVVDATHARPFHYASMVRENAHSIRKQLELLDKRKA